jgi:hypothetical protein
MEENLKFMQIRIEALQRELSLKDAELSKTKEKLTQALRYVQEYVKTLEVVAYEIN